MTDPTELDQASLDRIARLQQRRQPPPSSGARPSGRRRRPHPAAGGRVLAAGIGATTMLGITAVLALEAAADTAAQPEVALSSPSAAPVDTAAAPDTTTSVPAEARSVEGKLPPGFTLDDIDVESIPDGGVLTGEVSEDGRPVVVVFHPRTVTAPAPAPGAPAAAPAAPTALTATPVVTEVAVAAPAPAPAPDPAPPATTSGS